MGTSEAFLTELLAAVGAHRDYLERKELPRLREQFHTYHTALKSIISVFIRKSLIQEDPYKHDKKISEVSIPSTDPMLESNKFEELGIRLSDFESQLDFVSSLYQFNVRFLNLTRIKNLAALVRYIAWEKLTELSGSINTRIMAEVAGKVKQSADALSAGIVNDAQSQLAKATGEILRILKDLAAHHRESYKLVMRRRLFAGLNITADAVRDRRDELLKALKSRFAAVVAGNAEVDSELSPVDGTVPYYPELVSEILDEDYGPDSATARQAAIERIRVKEEVVAKKGPPALKPILLEAVRLLTTAGAPLEAAVDKLNENNLLLGARKMTFGERFSRWLHRLVQGKNYRESFEIEIVDPATSVKRKEEIDFTAFAERAIKRCHILANVSTRMSTAYEKLADSTDEQIMHYLDSNIDELREILGKLPALDAYFKEALGGDERIRPRGIKAEISASKTAIIKTNQKRHEYLSRKEELEQMKKLGIDVT